MRKRALQLTIVDPRTPVPPKITCHNATGDQPAQSSEININETVKTIGKCVAGVFAAYVAADTARQIAIYVAVEKFRAPQLVQFVPDAE